MFDLAKITLFNPALIYAFEPEGFPSTNRLFQRDLVYIAHQYEDMFRGYLHAQTIVTWIRENSIQAVSNEQFISCIKDLHQRMGATLLAAWETPPGEYTPQQVLRWNVNGEVNEHIIYFFSEPRMGSLHNKKQLIKHCVNTYGIDKEALVSFINLLERLAKDPSAKIDPSQERYFTNNKEPNLKGREVLFKLAYAYQKSQLTDAEKKSVEGILRVSTCPTDIPRAMNDYAQVTLAALKACDPTNLDQLAGLLAESFYQLTEIHPFANANGRVGTAAMNVFLQAFGYPSILLRHPGDKYNPSSDYAHAISQINKTREPLKALIKKRVIDAQQRPFSAPFFEELMNTRCQSADIIERMKTSHPKFDIEAFILQLVLTHEVTEGIGSNEGHIAFLKYFIQCALKQEMTLNKQVELAKTTQRGFSQGAAVDPDTREALRAQLRLLTGEENWAVNLKNGMAAWCESTSEDTINRIFKSLQEAKVSSVTKGKKAGATGTFCVICKDIDFTKLSQCAQAKLSVVEQAIQHKPSAPTVSPP